MPFRSGKKKSGQPTKDVRATSARIKRAGSTPGAKSRRGPKGGVDLEVAVLFIDGVDTITASGFSVNLRYETDVQLAINPMDQYSIATVNPGVPTFDQIVAGEDSTGTAAAHSETTTAANPKVYAPTGLAAETTYFVYVAAEVQTGNPDAGVRRATGTIATTIAV